MKPVIYSKKDGYGCGHGHSTVEVKVEEQNGQYKLNCYCSGPHPNDPTMTTISHNTINLKTVSRQEALGKAKDLTLLVGEELITANRDEIFTAEQNH